MSLKSLFFDTFSSNSGLVSPFERMAEERGLERGLQQRIDRDKELIIRLIQKKLGVINEDLQTQVKALNIDDLETLA